MANASPIVERLAGRPLGDEDDDDSARNHTADTSKDNDSDFDNDDERGPSGYFDADDAQLRHLGHAASPADRRAIGMVVKRYLTAAANENGSVGCALMYSLLAGAIVEDYGQLPTPAYMRGNTCAAVMTNIYRHYHTSLSAPTRIMAIRVQGFEARVLLGSTTQPAKAITVRRERDAWKIYNLIAGPLP